MHTTKVTDFPYPGSNLPFTTVTIEASSEGHRHINTSMSNDRQDVTIFFGSPAEAKKFASDLLVAASLAETAREMNQ